jgi:murein DD-endopeptidase MepM/ murein hydrolase activator NlpD
MCAATTATALFAIAIAASPARAEIEETPPDDAPIVEIAETFESAVDALGNLAERWDSLADLADAATDAWDLLFEIERWRARVAPTTEVVGVVSTGVEHVLDLVDPHRLLPRVDDEDFLVLGMAPVPGEANSPFGVRKDPFNKKKKKVHKGIDFKGMPGDHVHAAGPGVIKLAREWGGYGRCVVIDHGGGLETRYAHLRRYKVKEGEFVTTGTVIGHVGQSGRATGPHLHFEVRLDGEAINPHLAYQTARTVEAVPGPVTAVVKWLEPAQAVASGTALLDD